VFKTSLFDNRVFGYHPSMSETNGKPPETATAFDRFRGLASNLVKVPKKEVDRKEVAYQRQKAKRKRRSA
jgi:hypothetical protein